MQFGQQPSASFENRLINDFEVDTDHYLEKHTSLCFEKVPFAVVAVAVLLAIRLFIRHANRSTVDLPSL